MRHHWMVGAALAALSLFCHAQQYEIHDLGKAGGIGSIALDVNKKLMAVGITGWDADGLWRPGLFSPYQPAAAIDTPGPGTATGINKKGEVVGDYSTSAGGFGFIWKNNRLATMPSSGWRGISPAAINDQSEIVGGGVLCCSGNASHAWKYSNGKLTDLGTWGGTAAFAVAINKQGDIAGNRIKYTVDGVQVEEGIRIIDGKARALKGALPGSSVHLSSMNDRGDAAGYMYPSPGSNTTAFAFVNGKSKIIGSGQYGSAQSINNKGQVVGALQNPESFDAYAFLWKEGTLTNLNELPEVRAAGWIHLQRAAAISDEGVIVGLGFNAQNQGHAFMLVPRKNPGDRVDR